MSLRQFLSHLREQNRLIVIDKPISATYEIASVLKQVEPEPVLFTNVTGSKFQVFGNILCNKSSFAGYFGIEVSDIIPLITKAIENRSSPEVVSNAPCQEIVITKPDLDQLPILRHFENDGGPYITSGVTIAKHPRYGQNVDYHRCMQFSNTGMSVRIVRTRHFDIFLRDRKEIDVAICVGNTPNILASGAVSVNIGIDELEIANAMEPFSVVKAKTVDLMIPAECEFVIEGTIYLDKTHNEGPFIDLTETQDIVRQEPVLAVKAITHRKDALWQALLPGGLEHKLLMGMPREPTIYKKVNETVNCLDVNITPGGCSWLHAVVKIDKKNDDDGKKAIEAAFNGHRSCKHVFIVDKDIDIYNPLDIEYAMATRFQGDSDIVIRKEPGSSLDPSAEVGTHITTKIGFDLTKPFSKKGKDFDRVSYPPIDLSRFLEQ
jgi:2,5-furandicarboxylate decarboxylase 1